MGNNRKFKTVIVSLIKAYRFAISLLLGNCCRFEPSCSVYAIEAIQVHGCLTGIRLALGRLLRCHPWHAGGEDPVPLKTNSSIIEVK